MPLVLSVSARLPASIHTPTVDVWAHGECSVAIYRKCELVVLLDSLAAYGKPIAQRGAFGFDLGVDRSCESSTQGLYRSECCTTSQSLIERVGQPPRGHSNCEGKGNGRGQALLRVVQWR